MQQIFQELAAQQGWQIQKVNSIGGGDINEAFALETNKGRFFIKLNDASRYPQMFVLEAEGLAALQEKLSFKGTFSSGCWERFKHTILSVGVAENY